MYAMARVVPNATAKRKAAAGTVREEGHVKRLHESLSDSRDACRGDLSEARSKVADESGKHLGRDICEFRIGGIARSHLTEDLSGLATI